MFTSVEHRQIAGLPLLYELTNDESGKGTGSRGGSPPAFLHTTHYIGVFKGRATQVHMLDC
jgi:hypothetical protein